MAGIGATGQDHHYPGAELGVGRLQAPVAHDLAQALPVPLIPGQLHDPVGKG